LTLLPSWDVVALIATELHFLERLSLKFVVIFLFRTHILIGVIISTVNVDYSRSKKSIVRIPHF
jgi:hypothetical protein